MISAKNILAHELIGLRVTIEKGSDPNITGITGFVQDETRNTLTIETSTRTIRIAKFRTTLLATLPSGERALVRGNDLRHRPEDRVKKGLARW